MGSILKCVVDWPSLSELNAIRETTATVFSVEAREMITVVASPYRVSPLGAHVDHQGGSVTAMAINLGVLLGFTPSKSPRIRLQSRQYAENVDFRIFEVPKKPSKNWGDYAKGAVIALQKKGYELNQGINGVVDGTLGVDGGGISSSAALGIAILLALEHANNFVLSAEENIQLDREIENGYLGLRNGILDQSAILLSRKSTLTLIHCLTMSHELISFPENFLSVDHDSAKLDDSGAETCLDNCRILLAFSGLNHSLSQSPGYNLRVGECQSAASILLRASQRPKEEPILGNVSFEEYSEHKHLLSPVESRRAEHFFTEQERVKKGVSAWREGNMFEFGELISKSGQSSIVNYECGCLPLIQLREIVLSAPGVLGARFSGAGFRGCCMALVKCDFAELAANDILDTYKSSNPELSALLSGKPGVIICYSSHPARVFV